MKEKLEEIKIEAERELRAVSDEIALQNIKAKFVGRKGVITEILKGMREVPESERPQMGQLVNDVKQFIEGLFDERFEEIREAKKKHILLNERVDITLPGRGFSLGAKHPITQVMEEMVAILERMGFEVAEGPEVELDYYNFEALNMPKDHPARDMQDT
ncbi:MAG: phenylalanine--tRNA ligase subunit alpha, partial [Thermodesulfobacteriota bacterium]